MDLGVVGDVLVIVAELGIKYKGARPLYHLRQQHRAPNFLGHHFLSVLNINNIKCKYCLIFCKLNCKILTLK